MNITTVTAITATMTGRHAIGMHGMIGKIRHIADTSRNAIGIIVNSQKRNGEIRTTIGSGATSIPIRGTILTRFARPL